MSRNTGNLFCFNSSLSNLYNKKNVVRTVLFVNEFTEFSYSCYKGIRYWGVHVTNVNNSSVIQIKTFS
jgi:hypothetical protein